MYKRWSTMVNVIDRRTTVVRQSYEHVDNFHLCTGKRQTRTTSYGIVRRRRISYDDPARTQDHRASSCVLVATLGVYKPQPSLHVFIFLTGSAAIVSSSTPLRSTLVRVSPVVSLRLCLSLLHQVLFFWLFLHNRCRLPPLSLPLPHFGPIFK